MDPGEDECDEGSKGINEQASYAATKLRQLYDKLEYKRQALGSIQNAPKPDKKVSVLGRPLHFSHWSTWTSATLLSSGGNCMCGDIADRCPLLLCRRNDTLRPGS